jgi:anti-anti-sigma factor
VGPLGEDDAATLSAPGVRVERHEGVLVVALASEHDLASRESVGGALDGALAAGLSVVVDLREADFIDSVVAAVLLETRKKAKQQNRGLGMVLSDAHDNGVRRMFKVSLLDTVFAIYPSVEEAVEAVRAGFVEPAS